MKIKHYPGKAVANDPYLDMDARNPAMDLLYEASWLDAQRSLSSSSSGSNSWDRHSISSSEIQSLKLHKYTIQENQRNSSKKKKYHSHQYLSQIVPQRVKNRVIERDESVQDDFGQNYYLPSQNKHVRHQNSQQVEGIPNINRLSLENGKDYQDTGDVEPVVKYKNVISDLEVQLVKKSVRFHDKSEEIGTQDASEESSICDTENDNHIEDNNRQKNSKGAWDENEQFKTKIPNAPKRKMKVYENPLDLENYKNLYKSTTVNIKGEDVKVDLDDKMRKDSEEVIAERVNEWINEQNQYIISNSRTNGNISDSQRVANGNPTVKQCTVQSDNSEYDVISRTVANYIPIPKPRTIPLYKDEENTPSEPHGIYSSRIKPKNQTDEEFYDSLVNSRQRLPAAKNGFTKPEKADNHQYENQDVIIHHAKEIISDLSASIYKDSNKTNQRTSDQNGSDFLIPRPKLIVPVHTYAVRKRRTGNLRISLSESAKVDPVSSEVATDNLGEIFFLFSSIFNR